MAGSVEGEIGFETAEVVCREFRVQPQFAPRAERAVLADVVHNGFGLFVAEVGMAHQLFEGGAV